MSVPKVIEYRGYKITVTSEFLFAVAGPGFNDADDNGKGNRHEYPSLAAAKEIIDTKAMLLSKKRRSKIALDIYDKNGRKAIATGIHIATGRILGINHDASYTADNVYPAVPWIKALLDERVALAKRHTEINRTLHNYEINGQRDRRIGKSAEQYDSGIASLVEEHLAQTMKANHDAPREGDVRRE